MREAYLQLPCPAKGCDNEETTYWVHSVDYCLMKISTNAQIWCTGCSLSDHMRNWEFACSKHDGEYKKTSSLSFSKALFIASNNGAMDDDLIDELTKYLKKYKW